MVGALAFSERLVQYVTELVFCCDSQNACDHVFEKKEPVRMDGKDLWPAIHLARMLVDRLEGLGVRVVYQKIAREDHFTHCIAKHEQRRRYELGWVSSENCWPDCMDCKWLDVFHRVARNRSQGVKEYNLPAAVIASLV